MQIANKKSKCTVKLCLTLKRMANARQVPFKQLVKQKWWLVSYC